MSEQHTRRASCLIAAVVLLGLPCVAGAGLMAYVVYQEEVVEPKRRAADPEYAKRKDAERAKYKAEREAAARKHAEQKRAKAAREATRDAAEARADREAASREVEALLKRGGRALLSADLRANKGPAPTLSGSMRRTDEGLEIRARRLDRTGWDRTIYTVPKTGNVSVVLDIERFGSPYDRERDPLRVVVRFPERQLTVGMSYEQIYVTRGAKTTGYALAVPGRGLVRLGNDEPARRVLRVELIDGQVRVWLNGQPQLQGRARSTSTAGLRPKPWEPALARAASSVEIGAWLNQHTTSSSYEQRVVLGGAHVVALP